MYKNDLTTGNIGKKLILYFLPLAAGTLFQQLYSAVDGIIVGKYVGTVALAAVGGSAALISTGLVNFCVSLTAGGSILIAQFFGANNTRALSRSVHTSMLFAAICGVIISIAGFFASPFMLVLMKTPEETLDYAVLYLHILFAGSVFQLIYNMAAGILRAVGDSKSPFKYLAVSCTLNIVLDMLAVKVLGLGVMGAAWATVLSQAIYCFIIVFKFFSLKDCAFGLRFKELSIDMHLLRRMLGIGIPLALQSLMYIFTNMLIQVGINTLDTVIVAAWALSEKLDGFFWGFMSAADISISNFVGQNYGKGDYGRIKKGIKLSFIIFISLAAVYGALLLCSRPLLFIVNDDPAVIENTWQIILFFGPLYWTWVVNQVLSGALRGEGKTLSSFIITAIGICGFRLVWLTTAFKAVPTLRCLSASYPLSWVLAGVVMSIYYLIHMKHKTVIK